MKFIHLADVHFDTIFTLLNSKGNLGEMRRLEQRKVFEKVIEKIKKENINYLFISGDLYEQTYIKKSTIDFINDKFKEIPNTQIFISPGNHDPLLKNSYYNLYNWAKNVNIFGENTEKIETKDVNIYGVGFTNYEKAAMNLDLIKLQNTDKPNILVVHGTLDGSSKANNLYNPINVAKLKSIGFDYVALGHIHKNNINEEKNIIYPGSLISLGFDEIGEHGIVIGEIQNKKLDIEFLKMDETEFLEKEVDVTNISSKESLIESINLIEEIKNKYYKIIFIGNRKFEINILEIKQYVTNSNILKFEDKTKTSYDLESISNENTLKGVFVKNILNEMKEQNINKEDLEKALEIGLELL